MFTLTSKIIPSSIKRVHTITTRNLIPSVVDEFQPQGPLYSFMPRVEPKTIKYWYKDSNAILCINYKFIPLKKLSDVEYQNVIFEPRYTQAAAQILDPNVSIAGPLGHKQSTTPIANKRVLMEMKEAEVGGG